MNRFQFRQVLLFLISFMVFTYAIDKGIYYLLNLASDQVFSGQTIGKLNFYLESKDTTDILVFGSSRANHHIDIAGLCESGFNTGMDGAHIAYAATLIKLLPENQAQTVILHMDGYEYDYMGGDIARLKVKYHRNELIRNEIDRIGQHHPLQGFLWALDYNGTIFGIIKNLVRGDSYYMDAKGFFPLEVDSEYCDALSEIMLLEEPLGDRIEITELNMLVQAYILDVRDFCSEHNKRLLVITSPVFRESCLDKQKVLETFLHNESIDYYNFISLFDDESSLVYWKDRTHLSALGAEVFTEHLRDTLNL